MPHKGLVELSELSDGRGRWRVFHRPRKGRGVRWRLVAEGLSYEAAVAVGLAGGPGDWWYSEAPESSESSESSPETL